MDETVGLPGIDGQSGSVMGQSGFSHWEELPDYFRLADVFVMPSSGEGFGLIFLEAMADWRLRDRRKPRWGVGPPCVTARLELWSTLRIATSRIISDPGGAGQSGSHRRPYEPIQP
jgi:glycosyltransferase involved in cell wall biosynthesis